MARRSCCGSASCDADFEIGSGGRDAAYLEDKGYSVQRSEIAGSFIRAFEEQGISASEFDVLNDNFPGEQHLVFANSVFCHMTSRQLTNTLEKIYDALVPGGRLGFNTKSALVPWHKTIANERPPEGLAISRTGRRSSCVPR